MAQMQNFRDISCFPTPTPSTLLFTNEEIGGVISWMDFLRDQAICIIASRRNSFCKYPPKPRDPPEAVVPDVLDKKTKLQTENKADKIITDEERVQNTARTEEIAVKSDTDTPVDIASNPSPSAHAQNSIPLGKADPISTTESVEVLEPHTNTVLMRSGRSKSTMANLSDDRTKKLQMPIRRASAAKSADQAIADTEPKLRKIPNVILHEEDHPSQKTARSDSRESIDVDTSDVVRRFPKKPRGQIMSMYVYESNRRVSSENQSIRRPVSVVGFKMEPTDLVSKLSVKLKTRASTVSQNSIHRLLINDAMNSDVQKRNAEAQLSVNDVSASKVPKSTQDAEVLEPTPGADAVKHVSKHDVEIRERDDLFHETKPETGKFRASDSEILKPGRPQKTTRGQTNSLFVTRSERAMLLIDQKDRRPMSLG
ncbi:uncharacterized protein LOC126817635 isoform X2 [Patella vulgata]|nr:uncharacterized protein LOC126817635 isoform X2 [Patella vulgata]